MHPMATISTDLTLKIFEHIRSENRCDPTYSTTLSVHQEDVIELFWFSPNENTSQEKVFPATIPKEDNLNMFEISEFRELL